MAASALAASASDCRSIVSRMSAMSFSDDASLGAKTGGRASASWRWMVTASSMAARACSRRPRPERLFDWLFSDVARFGRNASGRLAASWR